MAYDTVGLILPSMTESLTLHSQRAETEPITPFWLVENIQAPGWVMSKVWQITHYLEMSWRETEQRWMSAHGKRRVSALTEAIVPYVTGLNRNLAASKKGNWIKQNPAGDPVPSHSLTFRWGNKLLLTDVLSDSINYLTLLSSRENQFISSIV